MDRQTNYADVYCVEDVVNLNVIISNLPAKKRVVAVLCRYGLSSVEIAEVLGISRQRVTQIYREIYKEHFQII